MELFMKLELDVYGTICEPRLFRVNGIDARYEDFGEKYDASPDNRKPHSCGNMTLRFKAPRSQVLGKYHISLEEYREIYHELYESLSFGSCRLCV